MQKELSSRPERSSNTQLHRRARSRSAAKYRQSLAIASKSCRMRQTEYPSRLEKTTGRNGLAVPSHSKRPSNARQNFKVLSLEAERIVVPSGEKQQHETRLSCPPQVCNKNHLSPTIASMSRRLRQTKSSSRQERSSNMKRHRRARARSAAETRQSFPIISKSCPMKQKS